MLALGGPTFGSYFSKQGAQYGIKNSVCSNKHLGRGSPYITKRPNAIGILRASVEKEAEQRGFAPYNWRGEVSLPILD